MTAAGCHGNASTCGTSSSWVTLTKFSNMATIEGAAITWQLTRSDRKRTYGGGGGVKVARGRPSRSALTR